MLFPLSEGQPFIWVDFANSEAQGGNAFMPEYADSEMRECVEMLFCLRSRLQRVVGKPDNLPGVTTSGARSLGSMRQ